jgi:hypothetical protein
MKIIGLVSLAVLVASAVAADDLHLITKTDRPLREICQILEERFHWRISYEEAPTVAAQDAASASSQLEGGGLRRRGFPVSIDLAARKSPEGFASSERAYVQEAMDLVLRAYNRSGNLGEFRHVSDAAFIHVLPVVDGSGKPWTPLLDTAVSIPRSTYVLDELVTSVLAEVQKKRGIPIMLGTVPTNLFVQARVTEEAREEPARDVLIRSFEEINGPRLAIHLPRLRLTWALMYSPLDRQYFFNVHGAPPELTSDEAEKRAFGTQK